MANAEQEKSAFQNLHHVGVIVKDIEKTIDYLTSLGIGPFGMPGGPQVVEIPFQGELHGKPAEWKLKVSVARIGGIELELLQPSGGESLWQEFIDSGKEGLHHIGFTVDDIDSEVEKLVKKGIKVLTGAREEKGGFAYFETDTIGGIITEFRQL